MHNYKNSVTCEKCGETFITPYDFSAHYSAVHHAAPTSISHKEAKHFDSGKPALHLVLFMVGLDEVARVGEFGAKKYGQYNYMGGMPWMSLLGSCTRHLTSFIRGENLDKESNINHLAHLVYDALMLLQYVIENRGNDDRYRRFID